MIRSGRKLRSGTVLNTIRPRDGPTRGYLIMLTNINRPLFSDLTHQQPRATAGRRASTAEDRMPNT
jgi:hypothetical protein